MTIIENTDYHRLCLFYKGILSLDEISADVTSSSGGAAVAYGIANWHLYNGDRERAVRMMTELTISPGWAAFGAIAAEADLAAL
jgi:hypothetical protein